MEKQEFQAEEGYKLRLEMRLKNSALVSAREQAGLTAKATAEGIRVAYTTYINYEGMKSYPSQEMQQRICIFFRNLEIPLFEDEAFPPELKQTKFKGKYIADKEIPRQSLIPMSQVPRSLLPVARSTVNEVIEKEERMIDDERLEGALNSLPKGYKEVVESYYYDNLSMQKIANKLDINLDLVRQILNSSKKNK